MQLKCTYNVCTMYVICTLYGHKKNATEMQLECTFNAPLMCCKIYITKMKSCIHSCIFGKAMHIECTLKLKYF